MPNQHPPVTGPYTISTVTANEPNTEAQHFIDGPGLPPIHTLGERHANLLVGQLNAAFAAGRSAASAERGELVEALKSLLVDPPHSDECRETWDIHPLTERCRQRQLRKIKCPACDRYMNARAALGRVGGGE